MGAYDKDGKHNVMTSSWRGICCSNPASQMTYLGEASYTYGNITGGKAFLAITTSKFSASQAVYVGRVSGRDVDKSEKTGLTSVKSVLVDAPYVKEFFLVIECELKQKVELGLHTMFIGKIMNVKADRFKLGEEGVPDIEKLKPFTFTLGSSKFYGMGELVGNVSAMAKEAEDKNF